MIDQGPGLTASQRAVLLDPLGRLNGERPAALGISVASGFMGLVNGHVDPKTPPEGDSGDSAVPSRCVEHDQLTRSVGEIGHGPEFRRPLFLDPSVLQITIAPPQVRMNMPTMMKPAALMLKFSM